jgi:hypothetical protein
MAPESQPVTEAIISGSNGTDQGKMKAMKAVGVTVVENLGEMGETAEAAFKLYGSALRFCKEIRGVRSGPRAPY